MLQEGRSKSREKRRAEEGTMMPGARGGGGKGGEEAFSSGAQGQESWTAEQRGNSEKFGAYTSIAGWGLVFIGGQAALVLLAAGGRNAAVVGAVPHACFAVSAFRFKQFLLE